MKKFLSILFILALIALIACVTQSVCATTLAEFRWFTMTISGVSVSGTSQISTAQVDSFIVWADQTVGTDFALSPYLTNSDTQTVTTTQATPSNRTQVYTMNSDFISGGLQTVMRRPFESAGSYSVPVGPPPPGTAMPTGKDQPGYVWTEGNLLIIQPAPRVADQFLLFYRAVPTRMIHADSSTEVDPSLHRMIAVLAAADVAKKLNLVGREAELRAEYKAFKSERLPATVFGGAE